MHQIKAPMHFLSSPSQHSRSKLNDITKVQIFLLAFSETHTT